MPKAKTVNLLDESTAVIDGSYLQWLRRADPSEFANMSKRIRADADKRRDQEDKPGLEMNPETGELYDPNEI